MPFCNTLYNILADERISVKKEKSSLYLVYNIVSQGKMVGKADPFSWW